MFEIPNAKRVRREDLYSASSSPSSSSPDRGIKAQLLEQYESLYQIPVLECAIENSSFTTAKTQSDSADADKEASGAEPKAFEFRLFSKPNTKEALGHQLATHPSRVILGSPSPAAENTGFVWPQRPDSYYFTTASPEQRASYEYSALSGEAVEAAKLHHWPGFGLPWRVMTIKFSQLHATKSSKISADGSSGKRRAGKKRRIILRKWSAMEKAKKAAVAVIAGEREAAEREKRTRRNREKKVKKKERDKLKKVVGAV